MSRDGIDNIVSLEEIPSNFFRRKFNNIYVALSLLCCGIAFQSMMVSGALGASISMIEKFYKYKSFQVAFIDTAYNIGFACFSLVLGFSIKGHKMRWVGSGILVIAVGCGLFIVPVFIKPLETTLESERIILCLSGISSNGDGSESCSPISNLYLIIMCLAYFLIGIGSAPLHTAAISFLDDNSPKEKLGVYTGIYYSCGAIGPLVAFLITSAFLRVPIHLKNPDNVLLSSSSPNWVGAYWLTYLVGAVMTLLLSVPLLIFPSKIDRKTDSLEKLVIQKKLSFSESIQIIKMVFKNAAFLLTCAGMFFDGLMLNGLSVFMSKYIESQFSVSPQNASLLTGVVLVPSSFIGLGLGGYGTKIFAWCPRKLIKKITIISLLSCLSLGFLFVRCENRRLHGVKYDPGNTLIFEDTIADTCKCSINYYFPVCVNDMETHFSPCTIGCTNQSGTTPDIVFSSCAEKLEINTVTEGVCGTKCKALPIFLAFGFIAMILQYSTYVLLINYTMRILEPNTRICGLSTQQFVLRVSYLCGPIALGPIIDSSCDIFNSSDDCSNATNCINYNLTKLSLTIAILGMACKLLSTIFFLLAGFYTKAHIISHSIQSVSPELKANVSETEE